MRAFIALVVAFIVISALAGSRTPQRRMAGVVTELHAGAWLSFAERRPVVDKVRVLKPRLRQ